MHSPHSGSVNQHYDAVIIGSGHNGLIAAAYLAKAGQSVLVLERNDYLGGATTSHRVFPEYDAQLSRYAYLVSLLPDQILKDLDLYLQYPKLWRIPDVEFLKEVSDNAKPSPVAQETR